MTSNFVIRVDLSSVDGSVKEAESWLSRQTVLLVEDTLDAIENAQILAYTSTSNPNRLRYERTFALRRASRRQQTGDRLPGISGEWWVDDAAVDYGAYVLGKEAEQNPIHRDRWKSIEDVEAEVNGDLPELARGRFSNVTI